MSELFKWLKKTEFDRRGGLSGGGVGEADLHPAVPESTVNPDAQGPAPAKVGPTRLDKLSPVKFGLEMADWRIRTVLDHQTLVGEQYRFLRAKLALLKKQRGIRTILVTSSIPAEGKTFTACCLSGILAQEPGRRVLLIDADLRKPRAAFNLGLNGSSGPGGFAQVLQGEIQLGEALLRCSNLDFFLLPAGMVPDNPSELLTSPNLERIIKDSAELFDWVIVDCPPVLALSDATRLAPLCDTVLLVVWANKTSSKLIKQSIQMIGRDQICGVVMNRALHFKSSRYRYYKHYSSDHIEQK